MLRSSPDVNHRAPSSPNTQDRRENELHDLARALESAGWLGKEAEQMTPAEHAECERLLTRLRKHRSHQGDDESGRLLIDHLERLMEWPVPEGTLTLIESGDISEFE